MGGERKTRKVTKSWGYHLIINAGGCDAAALRSKSTIAEFSKVLVNEIDMIAFGPPRIVKFGTGNKKGYTLVQLISTSSIVAHCVEETNDIYLDVFSCKQFNQGDALEVFKKYFNPKNIYHTFLKRQTPT